MDGEILDLDLVEVGRLIAEGRLSPVEVTQAAITRIRERDGRYHAFVTVAEEAALEAALLAEREISGGRYRGPLHGVPVAVKDIIAVRGLPMTAGSLVLQGVTSAADAAAVTRLRDAGAVLIGTTALDEFAFATVGPGMVNPADEGRSPGGSSGGSAVAVAAGLCFAALGTDTGGSVRVPASCCGIVGLKPTAGRISTEGVVPLAWSLDHVGPLTRTVGDAGAILGALTGEGHEVAPGDLRGLRVGVPASAYLEVAHPSVREGFDRALTTLADLGAAAMEVDLLDPDLGLNLQYLTVLPEAAAYHLTRHADRLNFYGPGVRAALEWGSTVSARDYVNAQRVRSTAAAHVSRLLEGVDVIALPTMPIPPPPVGEEEVVLGDGRREDVVSAMLRYTTLFNHTGHPAVSVPMARDLHPPLGLQLVGPYLSEERLLQVAAAYVARAG